MKKIIDIEDLLEYLKIPEFKEKGSQEVILKKITQQALFEEEVMQIRAFQQVYKEVSIPQTLFLDEDNRAFERKQYPTGVYYRPITFEKSAVLYSENEIKNYIKKVDIPNELYTQGYEFYINEENHLVAVVSNTYASSSNDYISYKPSTFSYIKEYAPILTYHYTNVYGTSANEKIKIESENTGGLLHRFPILSRSGARGEYTYQLSYYYKKDSNEVRRAVPAEEDYPFMGIRIHFKDLTTVLSFLNQTIFYYYDEFNDFRSKWRSYFLVEVAAHIVGILNRSGAEAKKVALIYHLSQPLYDRFEGNASLWNTLEILAKGYVRNNLSINEEDLILKLLKIIYHRYTHKQIEETFGNRTIKTEKEKQYIAGINNEFITNLITRKADGKLLLYKLVKGLDGGHFQTYVYFIWKIWKGSSYADINPETNKLINITEKSPVLLDYRSDKKLGFYTDNANINWEGKNSLMDISVIIKTGELEEKEIEREDITQKILVEKKEKIAYQYHPFSPVVLVNSENPKFILKEEENSNTLFTKLPAFILFANNETAFWQNVLKGAEYTVDILSTISGVGNILKAGRLVNLLKNGKTLFFKTKQLTKAITAVTAATGLIETSAATVNILFKLTGFEDTELGKTITKYLFYLEMVCLAGEVSVLLHGKLQETAKKILVHEDILKKQLRKNTGDKILKLNPKDKNYKEQVRELIEEERKVLKEIKEIAQAETGHITLDDYIQYRAKYFNTPNEVFGKLFKQSIKSIPIEKVELLNLFKKRLDDYPGLVKGYNQAEFKIKFLHDGKVFDEVEEFSLSGKKEVINRTFGDPPKLPENTVDVFENYDEYLKFVTGAFDLHGRTRKYDSEIKFIYNFIKNHMDKADEFIIETSNIFKTCGSCEKEFILLKQILEARGKKISFIVKTDSRIKRFKDMKDLYPELKEVIKDYEREYRKLKNR